MTDDLLNKWHIYKNEHYSLFTNLDFEQVKELHVKYFGAAPRVGSCRACIDDLLKKVFNHYENNKN